MKSFPISKLLPLSLVLVFAAAGCQARRPHVTPIPGPRSTAPANDALRGNPLPSDPNIGSLPINSGAMSLPGRDDDANFDIDREVFKEQTIYFDLDSATVKPAEKFKVEAVAAYLKSNPTFFVRVEGHCDERGTEEYNRALGERRALAVREALASLGIAPDRVSTLSFGEDKPSVAGHDEGAWTKNRRDEFVLRKPKS
jgi:peptidoglycan-associated lipoprotein